MAGLLDLFSGGTEDKPGGASSSSGGMSPMQLALLMGGANMLAASQNSNKFAPSLAAGLGGFGQGYLYGQQMDQQAQKARSDSAVKALEAQLKLSEWSDKQSKQSAIMELARSNPQQAALILANPDKFADFQYQGLRDPQELQKKASELAMQHPYKVAESFAGQGMTVDPRTGVASMVPGYAESKARAAGMTQTAQNQADAVSKPITLQAGGQVLMPPATSGVAGNMGAGAPRPVARASGEVGDALRSAANFYQLDPDLLEAIAAQESGFSPSATSPKGARGIMQMMPGTAREMGVSDPENVWQNVYGGARYLREQMDAQGGDVPRALAAYNAGPGAVQKHGGVPPYKETQEYIPSVLERYQLLQRAGGMGGRPQSGAALPAGWATISSSTPPGGTVESEYDKTTGKAFGEMMVKSQEAPRAARSVLAQYEEIDRLLDGLETGKLAPQMTEVKRALAGLGADIDTTKLGRAEAATAIANAAALKLRDPSQGGGMPGAMSDADREYLRSMIPGLGMTPEGRKLAIEAQRRVYQRAQEEARLMREYQQGRGGRLDAGIYDALDNLAQRPLFDAEFQRRINAAIGGVQPSQTAYPASPVVQQGGGGPAPVVRRWNQAAGRIE